MSTIMHILLFIEICFCAGILLLFYEERLDKEIKGDLFTIIVFFTLIVLTAFLVPLAHYHNDMEAPVNLAIFVIAPTIVFFIGFFGICIEYSKEIKKLKKEISLLKENNETLQKR